MIYLPRVFILITLIFISFNSLTADVIFPARLELREVSPTEFEVNFILPLINGQRLKSDAVLPTVCTNLNEKTISTDYTSSRESWRIKCQPEHLFGKAIIIEGLTGTLIEVMLSIETLEGRKYTTTLKPGKARYDIPEPPTFVDIWLLSGFKGLQHLLRQPIIFILFLLLVAHSLSGINLCTAGLTYIFMHLIGQILTHQNFFILSPDLINIIVLVFVLVYTFPLARSGSASSDSFNYIWGFAAFLGILYGGFKSISLVVDGFSNFEQLLSLVGISLGVGVGLVIAYFFLFEFRQVFQLFISDKIDRPVEMMLGYIAGVLATGFLLYNLTGILLLPDVIPDLIPGILSLPIIFGVWIWYKKYNHQVNFIIILGSLLVIGSIGGYYSIALPLGSLLFSISLLLIAMQLFSYRELPNLLNLLVTMIAAILFGWINGTYIQENLTLPLANTVSITVLSLFIIYISIAIYKQKRINRSILSPRLIGIGVIFLILVWRIMEYQTWLRQDVAMQFSMGLIQIPVLSLVVLLIIYTYWPKQKKIHKDMNLNPNKSLIHWILLMLVFFIIPYGTLTFKNPFFKAHAPEAAEAKRVIQQVLSNTYFAFNIDDEEELYKRLAQNISGDLVTDIYIDSRRRLTAGVRQGGEVTVRDVKVLSVGDKIDGTNAIDGYTYEGKWAVIARVRHLQHIHHRQNIYTGILKIKIEDENWKISTIELKSEDREVIPWSSG